MRCYHKRYAGFTVKELMITLGVIVVLGAIAYPSYINFKLRANYHAIVEVAAVYQDAVNACYEKLNRLKGCDGGRYGIPANITIPTGRIANLTVKDGVITAIPVPFGAIEASDSYILTPHIDNKAVIWQTSGGSVVKEYVI